MMLVLQSDVIVLALGGAVACLRLREPHPNWWDPHRGYRPPVGDDPIFWREYVLPMRGSRLPVTVMLARRLLVLLRLVLVLAIQLILVALAVAVPIGLFLGAGWFGYLALREIRDRCIFGRGVIPGAGPAKLFHPRRDRAPGPGRCPLERDRGRGRAGSPSSATRRPGSRS